MKKISLEQNTQEWLDFRKNRIGASDVAPILGLSPYTTRMELWRQKMGIDESNHETHAMRYGKENEEFIRSEMNRLLKADFKPACFEDEESPWLMCSVDGFDDATEILIEIKCANEADHNLARRQIVPPKYGPQLQTIMHVCKAYSIWYCSFHKGDLQYFLVHVDTNYIDHMIPKLRDFWDSLQNFTKPEIDEKHKEFIKEEVKYILNEGDEWDQLALGWLSIQHEKKELEKSEKIYRERIMSICQEKNMRGCGLKVTKRVRIGSVLYADVPELKGVDLEKYRKEKTIYWMIEND